MRLRVVMDGIQEVIDRAQVALNELAEILNPVELEEGPAEFPLPGGEFDDGPPPPTWDDGPLTKRCDETTEHASHLWFEGDNIAPWDCPGIGPELDHLLCTDLRMHDGHIWTDTKGDNVWCPGMPF